MLWFKKKRKKVHRTTRPIFKNQLTRTKGFFRGLTFIFILFLVVREEDADPKKVEAGVYN